MTMVSVYLHRNYTPMKKLSIESLFNLLFILSSGILIAQTPFLERKHSKPKILNSTKVLLK